MSHYSSNKRRELLGSASTAMALLFAGLPLASTAAHAATTTLIANIADPASSAITAIASQVVNPVTINTETIDAEITDTVTSISVDGSSGQSPSSFTLTENVYSAAALGNSTQNQIDLSTLGTNSMSLGAAAVGISLNMPSANVTATVNEQNTLLDLKNVTDGSAVNDSNTISASATANKNTTQLSGDMADVALSGTLGAISLSSGAFVQVVNADLVTNTFQASLSPNNSASVTSSVIGTDIYGDANSTVTSGASVTNNTVSADLGGNTSQSTIAISNGSSPSFSGSAALSNTQASIGTGTSKAEVIDSQIYGYVKNFDNQDITTTLSGSLSVDNNTISSTARNNAAVGNGPGQAGNEILIDDTLSYTAVAPSPANSIITYASGTLNTNANLASQSVQIASGTSSLDRLTTEAGTHESNIFGDASALNDGSISVAGNTIATSAQSNTASSKIANGDNAASFNGSAAISNIQGNANVSLTAHTSETEIGSNISESINDSSVTVANNAMRTSAYGNQANQSISMEATQLDAVNVPVSFVGDASSISGSALGSVVVGNIQANEATDIVAESINNTIGIEWHANTPGAMTNSTLIAQGNAQEAIAVGSSANNSLGLAGATVTASGIIANAQLSDGASSVKADSQNNAVEIVAYDSIDTSSISVDGNLQRTIAYGASAANTLSVDALTASTGTDVTSSVLTVGTGEITPTLTSSYGVVNWQSERGTVISDAETSGAFAVSVSESAESSSLKNDRNAYVSAAYGTDAYNSIAITANGSDTIAFAPSAGLINSQVAIGDEITARASGANVISTGVGEDVAASTVSTSQNAVQALAFGNRATGNNVAVNITNARSTNLANVEGGIIEAPYLAQNGQLSTSEITATLLTHDGDPYSADINTHIGGSIANSSVVSDANLLAANATANRASTAAQLDGTNLQTAAAVSNAQTSSSSLNALIGIKGTPATPFIEGTDEIVRTFSGEADGTFVMNGEFLTISDASGVVTFSDGSFSQEDADYLNSLDGVSGATAGGNQITIAQGAFDTTPFTGFTIDRGEGGFADGDETIEFSGFTIPGTSDTLATLGAPNQGGVTIAIGDDVISSEVSVAGNTTSGSVLANSASNTLIASATNLTTLGGPASISLPVTADYVLQNNQSDTNSTSTSEVYGTFAIDATYGAITGSSLNVSNNVQRADAASNLASNVTALDATNLTSSSALVSQQNSGAALTTISDLDMFAPGASANSTTQINSNANTARAVKNEASNIVHVDGANTGLLGGVASVINTPTLNVLADHALYNLQTAAGSTSAEADTQIINGDAAAVSTTGLQSSTFEIVGNTTTAHSIANLASNQMVVDGAANNSASAIVTNTQMSASDVTAHATTTASLALNGDHPSAQNLNTVESSTARIAGNATTAAARGNSASNILNLEAGAAYGVIGSSPASLALTGPTSNALATSIVLNNQSNTGEVSATASNATYSVALNDTATGTIARNSSFTLAGNTTNAEAYGNTATNRVTLTALNSGTPSSAIGNYQTNNGAVSATVTAVTYGITTGPGLVSGSTLTATGNRVGATAIGNNAVSIITAAN